MIDMTDWLVGRTAFVSGASSGLGAHFAGVLANAGARVALAARRGERIGALAKQLDLPGRPAAAFVCDVTDLTSIRAAVAAAETALGPIDILVNNAGVSVTRRIVDVTEADYDLVMGTNLKGAFFLAQEVGRHMIENARAGRIINISSVAAFKVLGQLAVYGISKAALAQMTKAMAVEWSRFGINVNALCPGYIGTEINADFLASEGGKKLLARLPRRRVGEPKDLDGALLLLAAGEESRFINGAMLSVDDGLVLA